MKRGVLRNSTRDVAGALEKGSQTEELANKFYYILILL